MPSPIANFGYIVNENQVQFTNLSLNTNNDTSYIWAFGDGNASTEPNPLHTYDEPAFYNVSLTVTQENVSNTIEVLINTTPNIDPNIKTNISSMIDLYSPTEVVGTIKNNNQKNLLIAKWQQYLQPLVFNPEVSPENTHNANAWAFLVNHLIAKLVVIDIIDMESSSLLLSSTTNGQAANTPDTETKGALKMIETGPAKTEWHNTHNPGENALNLAKAFSTIVRPGGVLDGLKASACQDAARVRIFLPMCGPIKISSVPQVSKTGKPEKYASNPFGITPRMT